MVALTRGRTVGGFLGAVAAILFYNGIASATLTQGDLTLFGYLESREAGRWGEAGSKNNGTPSVVSPATCVPLVGCTPGLVTSPGKGAMSTGGAFAFGHWDLVEARQLASIRTNYHLVKNYNFMGRFDTVFLKDADFFSMYRPWYDAFGTIKSSGVRRPGFDWPEYTQRDLQQDYFQDNLHEYYGQLNFTDAFSMRVGKQQVIWSEADALSGTEVTNPANLKYHWINFESPEDERQNIRMVKGNYLLPDFMHTTDNQVEAFWIPGDFESDAVYADITDGRQPYEVPAAVLPGAHPAQAFNFFDQPVRSNSFPTADFRPQTILGATTANLNISGFAPGSSFDTKTINNGHQPARSIKNSEFGARASTLLPIGNGLQVSFIYLWEYRLQRTDYCSQCNPTNVERWAAQFGGIPSGQTVGLGAGDPGIFLTPHYLFYGPGGSPARAGTLWAMTNVHYIRNNFFGLTGTYYDKDLTDVVYRYDALYAPRQGIGVLPTLFGGHVPTGSKNTEYTRFVLAGDRPTYIPWISKQHTFLVAQQSETWYPDLPGGATDIFLANNSGKLRRLSNLSLLAAVDWIMNGQLTTTNAAIWDWDTRAGFVESTNVFRYSQNVLLGANAIWYLGATNRATDPFTFSRDQRYMQEVEFTLSYEI